MAFSHRLLTLCFITAAVTFGTSYLLCKLVDVLTGILVTSFGAGRLVVLRYRKWNMLPRLHGRSSFIP